MLYFSLFTLYFFVFVFGICIGSFLNVLVYRLPNHISFVHGRSFCPQCHVPIQNRDLLPLFGYLLLRGKCRHCHTHIPLRYPIVEAITGLLAVWLFWHYGFTVTALTVFATACILLVITLVDFATMTIPNGLLVAFCVPALLSVWLFPEISLLARIIGFFVLSLPFYLLNFLKEDAMGGGDIKLMAIAGFMLGWQNMLLAMFLALLSAGLYILYLFLASKQPLKSRIAFGPYLCFGILIALVYGQAMITNYLILFNLH